MLTNGVEQVTLSVKHQTFNHEFLIILMIESVLPDCRLVDTALSEDLDCTLKELLIFQQVHDRMEWESILASMKILCSQILQDLLIWSCSKQILKWIDFVDAACLYNLKFVGFTSCSDYLINWDIGWEMWVSSFAGEVECKHFFGCGVWTQAILNCFHVLCIIKR